MNIKIDANNKLNMSMDLDLGLGLDKSINMNTSNKIGTNMMMHN